MDFFMDNLGQWVGLVGGVAGIIVLLTGAFVFVRGSYSKAKIEALRADNADLRNRVSDLEGALQTERDERQRDRMKHDAELSSLRTEFQAALSQNAMLADMITQRANVEAIHDQVSEHHKESMKAWAEIRQMMEEVRSDKRS